MIANRGQQKQRRLRLTELYVGKLRGMNREQLHRLLSGNPRQAAIWVRMAAIAGIAGAQLRLGRMLLAGEGLEQDPRLAYIWFRRAAAGGDADALNMLGRCYENGWGVAADPALAFQHYRRSAAAGCAWGQYNLGHCYLDGNGVDRDQRLAFGWYYRAAAQGHERAMNLLARCYEEGWGVEADPQAAGAWYRQSAEAGYFRGQYNWASLLAGAGQAPAAAAWYLEAARNGNLNLRRAVADALLASPHPELQACALPALAYCCETGEAADFYRYGQALLQGLGGKPDPEQAAYWLGRAGGQAK